MGFVWFVDKFQAPRLTLVAKNVLIMFMFAANAIADSALTQRRIDALDQWAEFGVSLAEKVLSEFGRSVVDGARALYRIAQAVRLAIALASRLLDPDNPTFQPRPAKPRAPQAAEAPTLAEKATEKPDRHRRMRFPEERYSDDAILRRPLAEIVRVICKALGVTPDWSLWCDPGEAPPAPAPCAAPARKPPPDPARAIPGPRPRAALVLDRPHSPPVVERLRARLRSCCAPDALIARFTPIAPLASGRVRPPWA